MRKNPWWMSLLATPWLFVAAAQADAVRGRILQFDIESTVLAENLVGLDTRRTVYVRLPAGYDRDDRRYPVVYWFHNMYSSPKRVFEEHRLAEIFERGMGRGVLGEVIVVAGDFTTPTPFNLFGNNTVAGRWIDHIVDELVREVDARFRTIGRPSARAATGDFFGGFASLKVGMWHPDVFGVVYALHPVGTGTGLQPGYWRPNWELVHAARTWEDLTKDVYAPIFVAMAQAYLPNPRRPPFHCDFMVERENGALVPNSGHIATLYGNFLLDAQLPARANALRQLRALKLDWGRHDPTQGHVYANQAFTRKLEEYGVPHAAEEYAGNEWNRLWIEGGRIEDDLLPFLARYLEGAAPRS